MSLWFQQVMEVEDHDDGDKEQHHQEQDEMEARHLLIRMLIRTLTLSALLRMIARENLKNQ
ncbi:hypothetical protein C1H46_017865 [Malus baccata]|uniref:Uncharacterized protein n=1 Tax=Malus baccata TaxID=106549 RepID=A0A540MCP4_MALBA|nr:hypothetical protein C1H46_017865 [Malus baccata]